MLLHYFPPFCFYRSLSLLGFRISLSLFDFQYIFPTPKHPLESDWEGRIRNEIKYGILINFLLCFFETKSSISDFSKFFFFTVAIQTLGSPTMTVMANTNGEGPEIHSLETGMSENKAGNSILFDVGRKKSTTLLNYYFFNYHNNYKLFFFFFSRIIPDFKCIPCFILWSS